LKINLEQLHPWTAWFGTPLGGGGSHCPRQTFIAVGISEQLLP